MLASLPLFTWYKYYISTCIYYFSSISAPHTLLKDGGDNYGRVIIRIDEEIGSVCDNKWGQQEATVVCRSMGYNSGEPMA